MPVTIRLRRGGRTHEPYYRIVVTDSRNRRQGRPIEELGIYHPCARPEPRTEINARRALEWLYNGAKPSPTVRKMLSENGIMEAYAKRMKPEELPEPEKAEPVTAEETLEEMTAEMSPAEKVIVTEEKAGDLVEAEAQQDTGKKS